MASILELMGHVQQQGELGRARGKQNRLADLMGQAYQAPRENRQAIFGQMAQTDPGAAFDAQKHFGGMDDRARSELGQYAAAFDALPDDQKPVAYPQLAQQARSLGLPVPMAWSPEMAPNIQKLAQALGGGAGDAPEDFTLSPGSARYGANGKLIAEQPFAPARPDFQMHTDPNTGEMFWIPKPTAGSMPAPTTGGGGQMLREAADDAGDFVGDVTSLVSPFGGRITSTTGGQHNPGSAHYSGNAIDIGMGRETPEQQAQILAALQGDPRFRVRDERTRPPGQGVWSGPHLHVERAEQIAQAGGIPGAIPIPGVRGKTSARTEMLSPQEVSQLGLPVGTVAQRKPDGSVSVVNRPTKGGDKPQMPVRAVMADLEIEDALGASESVFRLAEKHLSRMANGELVVGTPEAAGATVRTFLNMPNDNDVALTELKADRTSIVNASLRLNKGVQTEGDAQRAVKELMAADDHKTTLAALKRLIDINKRAVQLQTRKRNLLRQNYQGGEATQQTQTDDDIESLMEMYR